MDLYLRGHRYLAEDRRRVRLEGPQPPTVVFIHGGAWYFGDKRKSEHVVSLFLQRGYNVVNLNYSLKKGVARATQDVRQALLYLLEHNGRYGLDLSRVVLVGESAGAYMATFLAAAQNTPHGDKNLPEQLGIAGVVNIMGGGIDCYAPYQLLVNHENEWWRKVAATLVDDPDQAEAILEAWCPASYLNPGDPPVFLGSGAKDPFVTPAIIASLKRTMDQHAIAYEDASYPNSGHGFLAEDYEDMFQRIFRFIEVHTR